MKRMWKQPWVRHLATYTGLGCLIWVGIALADPAHGAEVEQIVGKTFAQTIDIILAVFLLIGLLQVWVPPRSVARVFGAESGWKGVALASIVPLLIGGSLFTILPLLHALREKGARIAVIGAFLTAWGGKLPLLPLEIKFLGWRFAVLRLGLIVPAAFLVGILLEAFVERRKNDDVEG